MADHRHYIAHVFAVHCHTVAVTFEVIEHQQQKIHPLLYANGVILPLTQILVGLSASHVYVQLTRHKIAVSDGQRVDCCTHPN